MIPSSSQIEPWIRNRNNSIAGVTDQGPTSHILPVRVFYWMQIVLANMQLVFYSFKCCYFLNLVENSRGEKYPVLWIYLKIRCGNKSQEPPQQSCSFLCHAPSLPRKQHEWPFVIRHAVLCLPAASTGQWTLLSTQLSVTIFLAPVPFLPLCSCLHLGVVAAMVSLAGGWNFYLFYFIGITFKVRAISHPESLKSTSHQDLSTFRGLCCGPSAPPTPTHDGSVPVFEQCQACSLPRICSSWRRRKASCTFPSSAVET